MLTIFEYVKEFWLFWFPADAIGNTDIIDLLSVVSTIALVWLCLIKPVLKITQTLFNK